MIEKDKSSDSIRFFTPNIETAPKVGIDNKKEILLIVKNDQFQP